MRVLGLMSGTSVDGIDVAVAEISGAPPGLVDSGSETGLGLRQLHFETLAWGEPLRGKIFDLFRHSAPVAAWCHINAEIATHFADAALLALTHAGLQPAEIDLIGSHGQTLWHAIKNGQAVSTLQVGALGIIAARTGITTVGNFRVADVALGGQGAPLVSTFDWHLLRPPPTLHGVEHGWRAVQNIGGIANVTFLPPQDQSAPPLAFDTGPGNALIDWAAGLASDGQLACDVDGRLAAAGVVDPALLADWLADPYFAAAPPKTTGRERFGVQLGERWWSAARQKGLRPVDLVATFTELTAASIAEAYQRFAPGPVVEVVVGGGGARNPVLMRRLGQQLEHRLGRATTLCTHEVFGIDSDAKEALAFALLAYLTIHGWPGNVPSCTGASRAAILGEIAPGQNYRTLINKAMSRH